MTTEITKGLEKLSNTLSHKDFFSFELIGRCDKNGKLHVCFASTIELKNDIDYNLALISLETSSYFPNVTSKNNKFYYYSPVSKSEKTITFFDGAYDIEAYNKELELKLVENNDKDGIKILLSEATARTYIALKEGYKVFFDRDATWCECLGFERKELNSKFNISDNIAHILPIQKIYVSSTICNGAIVGNNTLKSSNIFFSFPNSKKFGTPLLIQPIVLRDCPVVSKRFSEITLYFFSDDNEPIDFMGSQISLVLRIIQV